LAKKSLGEIIHYMGFFKTNSHKILILLALLFNVAFIHGKTCVSVATGNWSAVATWSCSPAGAPACGDIIVIEVGHTV
jgi:hypothetical protein